MAKKAEMTVKVENAVFDGKGGFLPVGATFTPPDAETAQSLRDKGVAG